MVRVAPEKGVARATWRVWSCLPTGSVKEGAQAPSHAKNAHPCRVQSLCCWSALDRTTHQPQCWKRNRRSCSVSLAMEVCDPSMLASKTNCFFSCNFTIFSSIVPLQINRTAFTCLV